MNKKYVDYVSLVGFYGWSKEFNFYCRKHKGISLRRNARNFLLKKGKYNDLIEFRRVGFDGASDLIKIAKYKIDYEM